MKHLTAISALAILLMVGPSCGKKTGDTTPPAAAATGGNGAAMDADKADLDIESVTLKNENDEAVAGFAPAEKVQKASVKLTKYGQAKVKGVFIAIGTNGRPDFTLAEKETELTAAANTADFKITLEQPLPAGDYKLDVYLNGQLARTVSYRIE